jgi:hypothetical protein
MKYGGAMDPSSVKLMAGMATLIRSFAGSQEKPVWAGEFNTCIEELPEKGQAEWLDKAVHAAIEQGVSWFSYWDSHDVDRKFAFNPLEYSLGLLTNDGRPKPAGLEIAAVAKEFRGDWTPPAPRTTALVLDLPEHPRKRSTCAPGGAFFEAYMNLAAQGVRPAVVRADLASDQAHLTARGITELRSLEDAPHS